MPHRFAVAQAADGDAIFDHVGDHREFRVALVARLLPDMHLRARREFAETAAEREQIRNRELLTAYQQYEMFQKRLAHLGKRSGIQRFDVTAFHLRADGFA